MSQGTHFQSNQTKPEEVLQGGRTKKRVRAWGFFTIFFYILCGIVAIWLFTYFRA